MHDLGGDFLNRLGEDIVKENAQDVFPYISNGVNPTINPPRNQPFGSDYVSNHHLVTRVNPIP